MRRAHVLVAALMAALWGSSGGESSAGSSFISFDIPPPSGSQPNLTQGFGISNNGVVVGNYRDSGLTFTKGFERLADGTLIFPIVAPGDNGSFTRANGVNIAGTIVGDFLNIAGGTSTFHGYLLNGSTFTQFDVGGPVSTSIFAINDKGDIAGAFGSSAQPNQGFLRVGNTLTEFNPPGANGALAFGINNLDQVVGQFTDAASVTHGFLRNANGMFSTIDVPGASATAAVGINDAGVISGIYTAGGVRHGFLDFGGTFQTYDAPGSVSTQVFGINDAGSFTGSYVDTSGVTHGFIQSVPEPSSLVVSGTVLLCAVVYRGVKLARRNSRRRD
jgi:probable HAF family extracellular repeat protein